MATMKTSILHLDPDPIARAGFSAIVGADSAFVSLGSAADAQGLLAMVRALRPDVVAMELDTPEMRFLKAIEVMRRESPATAVVLLIDRDRATYAEWALRAGAVAVLTKDQPALELRNEIRAVHRDQIRRAQGDRGTRVGSSASNDRPIGGLADLTPRERQVLRQLSAGQTIKQAAHFLKISAKTAGNHTTRLMKKLGLHERASLIRFAVREGIVEA